MFERNVWTNETTTAVKSLGHVPTVTKLLVADSSHEDSGLMRSYVKYVKIKRPASKETNASLCTLFAPTTDCTSSN